MYKELVYGLNFSALGITGFDELIGGGVPRGVSVLILYNGDCSWDASVLLGIICVNLLEKGETVVCVTNDFPSESYLFRYAAEIAKKAIAENRLFYIDLFSASICDEDYDEPNVIVAPDTTNLSYILYHFHEIRNEKLESTCTDRPVVWCYDNLSTTFFIVGHDEKCLKFIWNSRRLIKKFGDIFFATMDIQMHDPKVVATAKNIFDIVIDLESIERKGRTVKYLKVTKNAGRPFESERRQYTFNPYEKTFTLKNS